jgi:hypothetical protein
MSAGQNPPFGADINFWLKTAPSGPVKIEILDSTRKVVRTMWPDSRVMPAGLNRVYWNLQGDTSRSARLRTKPLFNEEFEMAPDGTRPGFGGMSLLMPPGRYTVRLTVNGTAYTQPLEVRKDPHSRAALAELHDQLRALVAIQRDHNATAEMVQTIESVRSQLQGLKKQLASDAAAADVRTAGDTLEQKFMDVEGRILDLRITGRGQDGVRWPVRLAGQLSYLASTIEASDFAPTVQQREVAAVLAKETRDVHAALRALINNDLSNFNSTLRGRGLRPIEVQVPPIVF